MYFVYLLRCSDHSFYAGVTNNVGKRLEEHLQGIDPKSYTFSRRPLELVYRAEFSDITDAIAFEKRVKRWSRKKKEALIEGDQEALEHFSKRRGGKPKA